MSDASVDWCAGRRFGHNGAMSDPAIAFAAAGPPSPPPSPAPSGQPGSQAWHVTEPERQRDTSSRHVAGYAIAVTPIVLLVIMALLAPGFMAPLTDDRVSLMGRPAGDLRLGILVLLAVIGIATVRFVRHPVLVGLVLFLTTSIGLTVLILAPSAILILINLKT